MMEVMQISVEDRYVWVFTVLLRYNYIYKLFKIESWMDLGKGIHHTIQFRTLPSLQKIAFGPFAVRSIPTPIFLAPGNHCHASCF